MIQANCINGHYFSPQIRVRGLYTFCKIVSVSLALVILPPEVDVRGSGSTAGDMTDCLFCLLR